MKKLIFALLPGVLALTLLTGCIGLSIGGGTSDPASPTVGQQLIDLQRAKDSGAITETEYQSQKARLLNAK